MHPQIVEADRQLTGRASLCDGEGKQLR